MKRYAVRVVPKPRLLSVGDGNDLAEVMYLGPYRWRWMARLRRKHFLNDALLRASVVSVTVVDTTAEQ